MSIDVKQKNNWRQSTPFDQLVVIRMAIEGDVDNLRYGNIDKVKIFKRLESMFDQMRELEPFLRKGEW